MQGRHHGSPVVVVIVVAAATLGPFLSPICKNDSSIILFGLYGKRRSIVFFFLFFDQVGNRAGRSVVLDLSLDAHCGGE